MQKWCWRGWVSTHSRPKAAGWPIPAKPCGFGVSTHSRPKAAGIFANSLLKAIYLFQLTAARRRLAMPLQGIRSFLKVSTHSRPKAAGKQHLVAFSWRLRFNSQPPEGGWLACKHRCRCLRRFQLTAARRRLVPMLANKVRKETFQLTAARRRLVAHAQTPSRRPC